jgi:hypothetical protein
MITIDQCHFGPIGFIPETTNGVRPPMVDSNLLRFLSNKNPSKQAGQSHAYLDVEDNENNTNGINAPILNSNSRAWLYQMHQAPAPPATLTTNVYLTSLVKRIMLQLPAPDTAPTTLSLYPRGNKSYALTTIKIYQQLELQQQQLEQIGDSSDSLVDFDDNNSRDGLIGTQFNRYRIASMLGPRLLPIAATMTTAMSER